MVLYLDLASREVLLMGFYADSRAEIILIVYMRRILNIARALLASALETRADCVTGPQGSGY